MLKFKKKRKSFGGFPARCAGCLLALFLLFVPFNAFAFTLTDSESLDIQYTVPSTVNIVGNAAMDNRNVFLFVDKNITSLFYLVTQKNFNQSYSFQSLYNIDNERLINSYYAGLSGDIHVYRYNATLDDDWVDVTSSSLTGINISYFSTSNLYLYAFYAKYPQMDASTGSNIWTYSPDTSTPYIWSNFSPKYYFNRSTYELNDMVQDGENESESFSLRIKDWLINLKNGIVSAITSLGDNLSTAINNIQGWLTTVKNGIVAAVDNIEGWLSSLGSTIGGFFTNIWNSISTTWSTFWTNLSTKLTDIKDNIGQFFIDLVGDIRDLFIPSDDFFTDYFADVDAAFLEHFGAVYQTINLSGDLLNTLVRLFTEYSRPDTRIMFPEISIKIQGNTYVIFNKYTEWISVLVGRWYTKDLTYQTPTGTATINFRSLIDSFISAVSLLSFVYFMKKQYIRFVTGNYNVGE